MEFAAFLRGVNVGRRTLPTARWARSFEDLRVVSVGAAGTFAISGAPSADRLRQRLLERVPFPTEAVLLPRSALRTLLASPPAGEADAPGSRRCVTFLVGDPGSVPSLPLERPTGAPWEVRLVEFRPPCVVGQYVRRRADRILYPNEVVEREFGVPATTRWWETLGKVEEAFRGARTQAATRPPGPARGRTGSPGPAPRGPVRSGRRTLGRTG